MASRTELELLIENRGTMLAECLEHVRAGETGGGTFADVCFHYRLLAIAHLLLWGDAARFADLLIRCGQARLRWLERADRADAGAAPFLCRSNDVGWEAFLVAGDRELAARVASLLPDAWQQGREYEEDFAFKHALHLLGSDATGADSQVAPILARLDAIGSDGSPSKAAIVRGLLHRDQGVYADGMATAVARREARFDELVETPGFSKEHAATERHVFVLGLASEQVARARGLEPVDLPTLPELARLPLVGRVLADDAWLRFEG